MAVSGKRTTNTPRHRLHRLSNNADFRENPIPHGRSSPVDSGGAWRTWYAKRSVPAPELAVPKTWAADTIGTEMPGWLSLREALPRLPPTKPVITKI